MAIVRDLNRNLARRLRMIRMELYGAHGVPSFADSLGIPDQTWSNYETGVTLPAPILLALIEQTGANPHWLLTGQGERYTTRPFGDRSHRAEGPYFPSRRR